MQEAELPSREREQESEDNETGLMAVKGAGEEPSEVDEESPEQKAEAATQDAKEDDDLKEEGEEKAREEAEEEALAEAEPKAAEEAQQILHEEAEQNAAEEAECLARGKAEQRTSEVAERLAIEEAEQNVQGEADEHTLDEAAQRAQQEEDTAEQHSSGDAERNASKETEEKALEEAEPCAQEESGQKEAKEWAEEEDETHAEEIEDSTRQTELNVVEDAVGKPPEEKDAYTAQEMPKQHTCEATQDDGNECKHDWEEGGIFTQSEQTVAEEAEGQDGEKAEEKVLDEAAQQTLREAEEKEREEAEQDAIEEANRLDKVEGEKRATEEAERLAQGEAKRSTQGDAEGLALEAEQGARDEATPQARAEAGRDAKEDDTHASQECETREEAEQGFREEADQRTAAEGAEEKAQEDADQQARDETEGPESQKQCKTEQNGSAAAEVEASDQAATTAKEAVQPSTGEPEEAVQLSTGTPELAQKAVVEQEKQDSEQHTRKEAEQDLRVESEDKLPRQIGAFLSLVSSPIGETSPSEEFREEAKAHREEIGRHMSEQFSNFSNALNQATSDFLNSREPTAKEPEEKKTKDLMPREARPATAANAAPNQKREQATAPKKWWGRAAAAISERGRSLLGDAPSGLAFLTGQDKRPSKSTGVLEKPCSGKQVPHSLGRAEKPELAEASRESTASFESRKASDAVPVAREATTGDFQGWPWDIRDETTMSYKSPREQHEAAARASSSVATAGGHDEASRFRGFLKYLSKAGRGAPTELGVATVSASGDLATTAEVAATGALLFSERLVGIIGSAVKQVAGSEKPGSGKKKKASKGLRKHAKKRRQALPQDKDGVFTRALVELKVTGLGGPSSSSSGSALCKVCAGDRCGQVARNFATTHGLKACVRRPLKAYLRKAKKEAVNFPEELEIGLLELCPTYDEEESVIPMPENVPRVDSDSKELAAADATKDAAVAERPAPSEEPQ